MLILSALSILPIHNPDRARQNKLSTPSFMSFKKNAVIYGEGEPADHLYTVTKGNVRTCKFFADGRRQICAFCLPGDTFGVETMAKHNFSAEAVTDVNILAINSDASNASQLLLMGRELKRAQNQVLLLAMNAPQRVATFLLEMAERIRSRDPMELPMSRQDIADYLGLTIETVSRTLTQLENEAAIALPTSKGVVLRNRAILKRLSA